VKAEKKIQKKKIELTVVAGGGGGQWQPVATFVAVGCSN